MDFRLREVKNIIFRKIAVTHSFVTLNPTDKTMFKGLFHNKMGENVFEICYNG